MSSSEPGLPDWGGREKHPVDQKEQFPSSNLQQIVATFLPDIHRIQRLSHPRLVILA